MDGTLSVALKFTADLDGGEIVRTRLGGSEICPSDLVV